MRFTWDPPKETANIRKHKLGFDFARNVFDDPLVAIVYDRFENGEHRYHAIGMVGWKCLLVVHTYPDPGDEAWVHVIGLREATADERKRYEEGELD